MTCTKKMFNWRISQTKLEDLVANWDKIYFEFLPCAVFHSSGPPINNIWLREEIGKYTGWVI